MVIRRKLVPKELTNVNFFQEVSFNQKDATGTYTFETDQDLHGGTYTLQHQGAVVSVANDPCDFSNPENPICPPPKHICGRIIEPQMCPFA